MFLWHLHFHFLGLSQLPLTEHNGQHLSGFLLPRMHAPESWIAAVRHLPQGCVCLPVGQIFHLAAHPDGRTLDLVVLLGVLFPSLRLYIQLSAATGGMADATVVLRVHWGQYWVLHWSRLWAFAPQASWEQVGLGRTWWFFTLLTGDMIQLLTNWIFEVACINCRVFWLLDLIIWCKQ